MRGQPGALRWERSRARLSGCGAEQGGEWRPSGLPEINLPVLGRGRAGPAGDPVEAGERRRVAPVWPGAVLAGESHASKGTISSWRGMACLHRGAAGLSLLRAGFLHREGLARQRVPVLHSVCCARPAAVSQCLCPSRSNDCVTVKCNLGKVWHL